MEIATAPSRKDHGDYSLELRNSKDSEQSLAHTLSTNVNLPFSPLGDTGTIKGGLLARIEDRPGRGSEVTS